MRAELHRRGISQMRVNNRSIQDMHIFGDPSSIPIVIVERVVNAPLHSTSGNSCFSQLEKKDTNSLIGGVGSNHTNRFIWCHQHSPRWSCSKDCDFCPFHDGYVPYKSARIEMCPVSSGDYSKKGKVFLEMINDCVDQIRASSSKHRVFMLCDVNFDMFVQGRNLMPSLHELPMSSSWRQIPLQGL